MQASNGTLNDEQRNAINEEAQQLVQEIDRIATDSSFNGIRPLDGSTPNVALDGSGDTSLELAESNADSLGVSDIDLSTTAGAAAAISATNSASERISETRASIGSQENRLRAAIDVRETQALNEEEALSRTRDLDISRAIIEQTLAEIQQSASIAVLGQSNVQSELVTRLLAG